MAWKILTLDATFEYVSKNDPDPSNPTLFLLRPLSLRTRNAIADGTMNFSPRQQGLGKATIHLASATTQKAYYGIAGWKNLYDQQGSLVPFETQEEEVNGRVVKCVKYEILDRLDMLLIEELATEIDRISRLAPETKKSDQNGQAQQEAAA